MPTPGKDFSGKVAIVTGSSSGIGEAIALLLAHRGACVTLCGRDATRLGKVMQKCVKTSGGNTHRFASVAGDLNDATVRTNIIDTTINTFGRMDILIANAGISPMTRIGSDTSDMYNLVMDTNLKSPYFLTQDALKHLKETKGNIVFVSSLMSTMALSSNEIYAMSKSGMDNLTRNLALSLAGKGIRVNCINPTLVYTRLFDFDDKTLAARPMIDQLVSPRHPLGGRASTAQEQAEVAVFLASDAASFVTGQCVKVDGGLSLGQRQAKL